MRLGLARSAAHRGCTGHGSKKCIMKKLDPHTERCIQNAGARAACTLNSSGVCWAYAEGRKQRVAEKFKEAGPPLLQEDEVF